MRHCAKGEFSMRENDYIRGPCFILNVIVKAEKFG